MDIKIENNDIMLNPNSTAVRLNGMFQAEQQVKLAFKIPKGSFIYDRSIGAFNSIPDFEEKNIESKMEALVNECFIHSDFYANVQYISRNSVGTNVGVMLDDGKEIYFMEVTFSGQL